MLTHLCGVEMHARRYKSMWDRSMATDSSGTHTYASACNLGTLAGHYTFRPDGQTPFPVNDAVCIVLCVCL